ncbi:MAG: phosphomannomutase/phosphoglucomutase [Eubacteriales bacterium]|jgi:phosphomannomutase
MIQDLHKLQNGSDIRGVAVDGVPGEPVTLTPDASYTLAGGFLTWLSAKTGKPVGQLKISVGHDSRISAPSLKAAVCSALQSGGAQVIDCGLSSTPSMFMSTVFPEFACDGAIMITASHLPYNRNGLKFFDKDGGLNKGDITALIDRAIQGTPAVAGGTVTPADLLEVYSAFLRRKICEMVDHPTDHDRPLTGLKIVVDAGNGAGGFFVEKVLQPLGADTTGSQFLEPDGTFPNHIPNPENQEAMESICAAVLANHADVGIIFDTDVDRSSAVDKFGHEISRNAIVALAAALVCEDHPGTTIVTDSVTSDELTVFIEKELGGVHHRFKRGYKNVINEAIRLNQEGTDCQLAIETSGHAALKENYFLDDGAYLATRILIKAARMALQGQSLDTLIAGLKHPLEEKELRFHITCEEFGAYGDQVLADLKAYSQQHPEFQLAPVNHEGLRFSFDAANGNGWCLLRKSLHDPIMPMNVESNDQGGCQVICRKMLDFLSQYDQLDLTPLRDFLK